MTYFLNAMHMPAFDVLVQTAVDYMRSNVGHFPAVLACIVAIAAASTMRNYARRCK